MDWIMVLLIVNFLGLLLILAALQYRIHVLEYKLDQLQKEVTDKPTNYN